MTAEPGESLTQQVRLGNNRELRVLAAQGLVPVPLEELVTLQVYLVGLDDEEISPLAAASLSGLEPQAAAGVIADAPEEVVSYLALNHPHPGVVEKAMQRRDISPELLARLAPGLDEERQEILLLRQDAIVESPEILDALETNERLTSFAARRIQEYRQHLVPTARPSSAPGPVAPAETEEASPAAAAEPVADGPWIDPSEVEGMDDDQLSEMTEKLLETQEFSEVDIRTLPVPIRMKLSRGAPRNLRQILIRDANPAIALSVLNNNAIPESELEQIASNRSVLEDVLEGIARNPRWIRKYRILRALVGNPRTPVGLAVRLTGQLGVRDLRSLSRDRNISEAVRATALRLYRIKLK